MGLIAGLGTEQFNFIAIHGLNARRREILGFEQAGVAFGVIGVFEQQHQGVAVHLKGMDTFGVAARIKEEHVHGHGRQVWRLSLSVSPARASLA